MSRISNEFCGQLNRYHSIYMEVLNVKTEQNNNDSSNNVNRRCYYESGVH
jgi:hypothetical protein